MKEERLNTIQWGFYFLLQKQRIFIQALVKEVSAGKWWTANATLDQT